MVAVGAPYVVRSFYLLCLHLFMVCGGDLRGMGFFLCESVAIILGGEGAFLFLL